MAATNSLIDSLNKVSADFTTTLATKLPVGAQAQKHSGRAGRAASAGNGSSVTKNLAEMFAGPASRASAGAQGGGSQGGGQVSSSEIGSVPPATNRSSGMSARELDDLQQISQNLAAPETPRADQ